VVTVRVGDTIAVLVGCLGPQPHRLIGCLHARVRLLHLDHRGPPRRAMRCLGPSCPSGGCRRAQAAEGEPLRQGLALELDSAPVARNAGSGKSRSPSGRSASGGSPARTSISCWANSRSRRRSTRRGVGSPAACLICRRWPTMTPPKLPATGSGRSTMRLPSGSRPARRPFPHLRDQVRGW